MQTDNTDYITEDVPPKRETGSSTPEVRTQQTPFDAAIARKVAADRARRPIVQPGDRVEVLWPADYYPVAVREEGPMQQVTQTALDSIARGFLELAETYNAVPYADRGKWHDKAAPAATRQIKFMNEQITRVDASLELCEQALANALKPPPAHAPFGPEIRAVVKRDKIPVTELIRADFATVSAVLAAPPIVTGLSQQDYNLLREQAAAIFCPAQTANLKATKAHKNRLVRAVDAYASRIHPMLKRTDPKLVNDLLARIS